MKAIEQCPVCGGTVENKSVTEVVRGGGNTVTLTLDALVCEVCGECFHSLSDVRTWENLKLKLECNEIEDF